MSEQSQGTWLTQEAYDRLAAELEHRKTTERKEIAQRVEAARHAVEPTACPAQVTRPRDDVDQAGRQGSVRPAARLQPRNIPALFANHTAFPQAAA